MRNHASVTRGIYGAVTLMSALAFPLALQAQPASDHKDKVFGIENSNSSGKMDMKSMMKKMTRRWNHFPLQEISMLNLLK